jgi:ADP-heptose:LPS heptosyltransferase
MTLMALGHASTMARAAGRAVLSLRCAPAGFREFLEDPRVVLPAGITWIPEDLEARVPLAIDAEIPHLVYPRAGYAQCPHMVQGMLAVLEPALGGRADPGWSPDSPMGSAKWYWPRPAYMGYPYAVFAAATDKPYKQWADDHWVRLARTVRDSGIAVARVGLGSQLPSVLRIETAPPHTHALADVCDTLVGARTVVTLEHGIAHLCGMLGVPCHVLYSTRHSYPPERFLYATSTGYAMEDPDTYARLAAAVLRDVATPG